MVAPTPKTPQVEKKFTQLSETALSTENRAGPPKRCELTPSIK